MGKYVCESCDYIYDSELGDDINGIPKGTEFKDLPDNWICPICNDDKNSFVELE